MKKLLTVLLALLMVFGLAACNGGNGGSNGGAAEDDKHIETLKLQFVPSRPAEEIIQTTDGLGELLIAEMAKHGYTIDNVEITVGDSFEAAGEALSAGSVDLAWLPSGTYIVYSDDVEVILTATRNGLSNDSKNPADWNGLENMTLRNGPAVTYYKGLIYAGPSEKGQALAAKVNAGEALTWEDISEVTWGVGKSVTSNAGYSFPTKWLLDNFDKKITDLPNVMQDDYAGNFQKLAAELIDVTVCYADGRDDYAEQWMTATDVETAKGPGWGREKQIWEEVNVIGVTDDIYNDTIAITKANPAVYNDAFKEAFCLSMEEIVKTEKGQAVIAIYTHTGYQRTSDADYEPMRQALKLVQD